MSKSKGFSHQNLQGRSFKGQNLEGADFSYADIRGVDFTGANLRGANFTGAKAGLPLRWAIFLIMISCLLSGLSGFLFLFSSGLISLLFDYPELNNQFGGWAALILTIIICQGRTDFATSVAVARAEIVALFSFIGVLASTGYSALVVAVVVAIACAFVGAVAVAVAEAMGNFAVAVAITFAIAGAVAGAVVVVGGVGTVVAVGGVVVFAVVVAVAGEYGFIFAITTATAIAYAFTFAFGRVEVTAGFIAVVINATLIFMIRSKKYDKIHDTAVAFGAFSGTTFHNADLTNADLTSATLKNTDFRKAKLTRTRFYSTEKLDFARVGNSILSNRSVLNLLVTGNGRKKSYTGLNLKGANLINADLKEANLKDADVTEATFQEACLEWTNLSGLNFIGANLKGANFIGADLKGSNFSRANLKGANLSDLNLSGLNLIGANLSDVNLSRANLNGANFKDADLSGACLIRIQALGTNFTTAKFTGACLEDWNINSTTKIDDIDCKYVYLKNGEQERRPSSGEFAPGEFTKLFQKALETVDLIFADGIDWKAFLKSFQELQTQYGDVAVQAIEKKSGDSFVIRLEVPQEINKAEIECQAKELYEIELSALEARYHAELQAKNEQIAIYRQHNASLENIINMLGNKPIQNIITVTATAESESMSESYKSKYELSNAQVGGIVDTAQAGSHQTFNQHNYAPEQKQNLTQAAAEIQALLEQLDKTYSTDTTTGKMALAAEAIAQIDSNPTLTARILSALKVGSVKAFEQFLSHPAASFVIGALEDWQKTKGS